MPKIHANQTINCLLTEEKKIGIKKKQQKTKALIDYSQTIDDVYENLEDHNPTKKRTVLIVLDDMMADIESNKKLSPIVTELFLGGGKLNISLVVISQSYFNVARAIRINATCFIMEIPNKRELQQITNHLSDIEFKDFMNLYKDYTKETYSFFVNHATFPYDDPLQFRKNLL